MRLNGQVVELLGGPGVLGEEGCPLAFPGPVPGQVQGDAPGWGGDPRGQVDISFRLMVPVVALARVLPVRVPAAQVRLKAMVANTNQAAFAVNLTGGNGAMAEFFRSAWTCSMIAGPRWVLSAVTVSRVLVVKNAWERCASNRVPWPSSDFWFSSGMRRTMSQPVTWSVFSSS